MKITPIDNDRRRTGNRAWPSGSLSSRKIASAVLDLKALIQRGMDSESVREANRRCDDILFELETVEDLENINMLGGA